MKKKINYEQKRYEKAKNYAESWACFDTEPESSQEEIIEEYAEMADWAKSIYAEIANKNAESCDALAQEIDRLHDEISDLKEEIEFLRRYGNKDCTAMANEALEAERKTR